MGAPSPLHRPAGFVRSVFPESFFVDRTVSGVRIKSLSRGWMRCFKGGDAHFIYFIVMNTWAQHDPKKELPGITWTRFAAGQKLR